MNTLLVAVLALLTLGAFVGGLLGAIAGLALIGALTHAGVLR